jgi:two-component system nitrate/nitrite response regulator NarP
MAKMVVALNNKVLSAGLELRRDNAAHGVSASQGPDDSLATATSMTPAIVVLAQSSSAARSLGETIIRLQRLPAAPKVVLLLERAADTLEIAKFNVDGIVMSSPQVRRLLECIESVADGRRWVDPDLLSIVLSPRRVGQDYLTIRERQIVGGVVRGLRNKEIAREMGLRESTVKMHLHHVFDKLKLGSRTQLALAYSSPDKENAQELHRRH